MNVTEVNKLKKVGLEQERIERFSPATTNDDTDNRHAVNTITSL